MDVFEAVSRAVPGGSRKRRGVSRTRPNITQRSLFRATRRGRRTEQERPRAHWTTILDRSPSTSTAFFTEPFYPRPWIDHSDAATRDLRGWSIDIPRGSATFFPPFLAGGQKGQARATCSRCTGESRAVLFSCLSPSFSPLEMHFRSALC